ncbi:MAG: hypothetical protein P4L10_12015 [Acidobacteriaceae bacterium]|nr:hypothetical protein [Acidobacteriaceae bacterium]
MQHRYMLRISVLCLLALLYAGLAQKYRAYDIDNPWALSFSYNACHNGGETDTFGGLAYPSGMDGVHLFGKAPAAIQCAVFNRTGWTPRSVVLLNVIFGLASLLLWWLFLRRMGYRENWIAVFILMLGMTEPMVAMVEKARYEFFTFFLLSLGLWLGVQGLELAAVLVAAFAVETHPIAVVVPIVIVVFLAVRTKDWKRLALKAVVSAGIAAAFYLYLHPHALQEMAGHSGTAFNSYVFGGIWNAYFIQRHRHVPELIFLVIGALLYWAQQAKIKDHTGMWLALTAGGLLFFQPHLNPAYAVYAMPFFLWVALQAYDLSRKWIWVPALVFSGILLQYAYLYKINRHEGFGPQEFAAVGQRITESERALGIQDAQLNLCGDYSLWFAHPQNYSTCSIPVQQSKLSNADLFLCFDAPLEAHGLSEPEYLSCSKINTVVPLREISSLEVRGHLLHIEARR